MLRDCKYRLPCAWCDKYDRQCLAVEYEIIKQGQEKNSKPTDCIHNWELLDEWFDYDNKYVLQRYLCKKCGETEFRAENGSRQKPI